MKRVADTEKSSKENDLSSGFRVKKSWVFARVITLGEVVTGCIDPRDYDKPNLDSVKK